MNAVSQIDGISYDTTEFDFGGERYLKTGEILPDGAVDDLKAHDCIYLGAIGHPDVAPGILERKLLLDLRFSLDHRVLLSSFVFR